MDCPKYGFSVERGGKVMKGPLSGIGIYIGIWPYPYIESAARLASSVPYRDSAPGGDKSGEYITTKSMSQSSYLVC